MDETAGHGSVDRLGHRRSIEGQRRVAYGAGSAVPGPFQVAAPAGALLVMTTGTPRGRVYSAAENGSGAEIFRPAGTGPKRVDLPGAAMRPVTRVRLPIMGSCA
ncbi:hypothetical protein GCM10009825_35060 [Arthrobacter humicola]|uniref:Uncharacterized protein n=1 Tax=Arthrobacter humicola TaxID=409291 RepID=A0ABN2ZLB5_9MICC